MAINPDLLIAAPMLQDFLIDKDGTPMSAGIITCYQDNSRTTLKNWYYQSGTPGNYTYIRLPNPLTLSAAGTICDVNGVDTIPFWYPYSEADETQLQPYYVTIVNHAQTNEITRANFPFNPGDTTNDGATSEDNYIINNVFWRNIGTANLTNVLNTTVCPSQHDGFRYPDVEFIKNNTGGQDTVTFTKFPLSNTQALTDDITPEYYLNHTCSNANTGETQKCYQFPISLHVNTLNAVPYTCTIQAMNNGGTSTGENTINLFILQDTGTGTVSPNPVLVGSITLNSAWTKYEFSTIFPSTAGLTLGAGADDALYLQVQMPLNTQCNINFTKPSIYLTNNVPTNSFATYDEIDAIINSPRTGDIRTSLNTFYYFGWVPMNNGTIGNASSNATSRANADTWQLFNLIWTAFSIYNNGTTNTLAQMVSSAGSNVAYGASAIADFNANKAITLSPTMGRVILGAVPVDARPQTWGTSYTASSSGGLLLTTTTNVSFFNGLPIYFQNIGGTFPTGIDGTHIYYVANFNGTNAFNVATSFDNAMAGTVIAYTNSGTPTNNVFGIQAGTSEGEYAHTQLVNELAQHQHNPLAPMTNFWGDGTTNTTQGGAGVIGRANTTGNVTNLSAQVGFNITQPGVFMNIFMKL